MGTAREKGNRVACLFPERCWLEVDLQSELNLSLRVEPSIGELAEVAVRHVVVGLDELRRVEEVVELRAELHHPPLGDVEVLEGREVDVSDPGAHQRVAGEIAWPQRHTCTIGGYPRKGG